jgi:uncharacterized membrane protein YesL
MNNGGFMGGLYVISEWIMRFSVVNLLWLIFNFPILYILLNMLFIEQIEMLSLFFIPFAILSPILLFPATTALFASVRDWVMKNDGHGGLLKSYWHYYKENYLGHGRLGLRGLRHLGGEEHVWPQIHGHRPRHLPDR